MRRGAGAISLVSVLVVAVMIVAAGPFWAQPSSLASSPEVAAGLDADGISDPTRGLSPDYVEGEVLIRLRPGTAPARAEALRAATGAERVESFARLGIERWALPPGPGVEAAVHILSLNPNVEYAEPNFLWSADDVPNDARRSDLWGMHNLGQTGGTLDADIDALEAWAVRTDASAVVVGVIDTGVDYTHEDLVGNIWTNPNEIAGNGIDDDGNGYVDDVRGWDCVNDDNDPMDDNNHGTHVSGTIGARGNNGVGVAGVSWSVQIMPLKFLGASGSGSTSDAIECINYAASFVDGSGNKVVRITSNSWGGGRRSMPLQNAIECINYAASFVDGSGNKVVRITSNSWGGGRRSMPLQNAIEASGALFVAAAGNSGSSGKMYPAAYPLANIISVAATDANDALASFSNYGTDWVDLGAPGVGIISPIRNNMYGSNSGTSMATPHVSGAAALVLAANPAWTNDQVKTHVLGTVDVLSSLSGKVLTGGRLNVRSALGAGELSEDGTPPGVVADLLASGEVQDSVTLTWTATGDGDAVGAAYLNDVRYATEPIDEVTWDVATRASGEPIPQLAGSPETFVVSRLMPGTTYYFALKAMDEVGNVGGLSNLASATTLPSTWAVEAVEAGADVGFYHGHAYDPSGNPAVAYSQDSQDDVKFAHWNGASWDVETVDAGTDVYTGIDIAYSPLDGNPSISYGWGKLKFAHRTATGWSITTLETRNANNDITSLAYAPDGGASIAYRLVGNRPAQKFARQSPVTGAWTLEVVDPGAHARYTDLAYDLAGNPAMCYSVDIDEDNWLDTLKYAHWNGASWDVQIVETGVVGYGVLCSLAFDPLTGFPAISHQANGIRVALWNGASWDVEVFGSGGGTSLAYDSAGTLFMSYSSGGVRLAKRTATGWEVDFVDVGGINWYTRLQFDALGKPSISYSRDPMGILLARKA